MESASPSRRRVFNIARIEFIRDAGENNLFLPFLIVRATQCVHASGGIAVEECEKCHLLVHGLQLGCDGVSHETAKGPTEEIVGADGWISRMRLR